MRSFPLLCALVCLTALPPSIHAADECRVDREDPRICAALPLADPGLPPQTTPVTSEATSTYYLYLGLGACMDSAVSNDCRGTPVARESGLPLPSPVPNTGVGAFGVLYRESNGVTGLQRTPFYYGGGLREPDQTVLI